MNITDIYILFNFSVAFSATIVGSFFCGFDSLNISILQNLIRRWTF